MIICSNIDVFGLVLLLPILWTFFPTRCPIDFFGTLASPLLLSVIDDTDGVLVFETSETSRCFDIAPSDQTQRPVLTSILFSSNTSET